MPTLCGVKAGKKFLKEVPKDNFRKSFIMRLKTEGKFLNLQL
jgi:hypothetical protein